jgi:hypothetical protein
MRNVAILLFGIGLFSCNNATQQNTPPAPTNTPKIVSSLSAPSAKVETPPTPKTEPMEASSTPALVSVEEKPSTPSARLDAPLERRLYTTRIEANQADSRNYPALFLMDNDEETSWSFPKKFGGARFALSTVQGATQVRLKILSGGYTGYYPKTITITAMPGGQTISKELAANSEWQEIVLDLAKAKSQKRSTIKQNDDLSAALTEPDEVSVNGLSISFEGVKKNKEEIADYGDAGGMMDATPDKFLMVKEVEVYVTGLTPENPDFEKEKLKKVEVWKTARKEAEVKNGKGMPLATLYEIKPLEPDLDLQSKSKKAQENPFSVELDYTLALDKLSKYLPKESAEVIEKAKKTLKSSSSKWVSLQVTMDALKPYVYGGGVAGVSEPYMDSGDEKLSMFDYIQESSNDFLLPRFAYGTLLVTDQLTIGESESKTKPKGCEKTAMTYFWKTADTGSGKPRELIVQNCLVEEDRGGSTTYRITEILEYNDLGQLQLWVNPYFIQWFDWKEEKGASYLAGGFRATGYQIDQLAEDPSGAKKAP